MGSASAGRVERAVFLVDAERGSYRRAADLYRTAFVHAGIAVEWVSYGEASARDLEGQWVVHHTIGPLFQPIAGAVNTAVVFHEWSRYPAGWLETLNRFEALWAPSRHVQQVLVASGATAPVHFVPPPLVDAECTAKATWHAGGPFRLLSVGEPHFRKGFHLLLEGFQRAFPRLGEAELTLKVSPSCDWTAPRPDVHLVRDALSRDALAALVAAHDGYVTASLGEGLGLPVAEAILSLLPVAANRWGGHADLVDPGACWEIGYDEVPQLYCSHPTFYAEGQRCAYSAPDRIATALRAMVSADADERERRARRAHAHLARHHGLADTAAGVLALAPTRTDRPTAPHVSGARGHRGGPLD